MQGVISPMTPCTPTVTAPRLVSGAAHSQTCEVLDADHCYEPLHTPFRACPACSAQGAVIYPSLRKRLQREGADFRWHRGASQRGVLDTFIR